jgi:hypothetical protein
MKHVAQEDFAEHVRDEFAIKDANAALTSRRLRT